MPPPEREQLFKPFQRRGDSGQSQGVGLGLALSLLLYIPLYYYRTRVEDKRVGEAEAGRTPVHAIHEK